MTDLPIFSSSSDQPGPSSVGGAFRAQLVALAVFEHSLDGVLLASPEDHVLGANAAACEMLRVPEADLVAGGLRIAIDDTDRRWFDALAARKRSGRMRANLRMRRGDGSVFEADVTSAIFATEFGDRACVVFRDISDHVALVARQTTKLDQLERLALVDDLTGLANRRGLFDGAQRQFALADRSNVNLQVLFVDVDGLKRINDTLSHDFGDRVLARVGAELRAQLRLTDVAGRYGGDEFVVVLYNLTRVEAETVAARIKDALAHPPAGDPEVAVSIGIAAREPGGASIRDILGVADELMYRAKNERGNPPSQPPASE